LTLAYNEGGTPFALGAFGEFFRGRFRVDNSISVPHGVYNVESRGDLQSFGGGMFVQYRKRLGEALESGSFAAWIPGPHLEATARLGHSRMDFETDALNSASFFNEGAAYYGASLGGGRVFEWGPKFLTDLYGHGIWTAQRGRDIQDSLGHRIEIDDIHSLRLVSGFRSSYMARDNLRPYLGLAADWETMSRPRVYVDGYQASPAKLTGLSGLVELGVGLKTGDRVFMDFKATGSAGKRRGLGGLMEIRYAF
jgi:outer membrane autotransporter protein